MRLLLFAEVSAAAVIGGAERVLREQALGLARRGHEVAAVVRAPAGDPRPQVAVGSVEERRYRAPRGNALRFVLASYGGAVGQMDAVGGGPRWDAAIVHQALAGLGPILRRRDRVGAWVYVCHSLAHEEYLSRTAVEPGMAAGMRRSVNARMRLWCERAVLHRCDRIVVLSDFMKERVLRTHGIAAAAVQVVPGAVDVQRFQPAADVRALRERLKLPPGKRVLFALRNLVPRMGLENLVRALAMLRRGRQDVLLVIGGEGPLRPSLQRVIGELNLADAVQLLGFVAEEDLPRYYQAADLVVMPTVELEGFGLVTVEALACGTPVVGTPVGAIPEVLTKVDPRLVAEGCDPASLAAALERTLGGLQQPGEAARLAGRARELVLAEYHWDRHMDKIEAVLEEARGRRR